MNIKRTLPALLGCTCLLAALLGCQADPASTDSTAPTAATAAPVETAEPLCIFNGAIGNYKLIRAEESTDLITEATTRAWRTFEEEYKTTVTISTDWVKRGTEIPTDTLEILVGPTNRPESAAVAAEVADGTYRVKAVGSRIVICAASEWMLEPAVDAFLDAITVDAAGRGTVPTDLDLVGDLTDYARPGWLLDGIPAYDEGRLADKVFVENLNFKTITANSRMMGIANTKRAEFEAYLEKVKSKGFTVTPVTDQNGIFAVRFTNGQLSAYAYFTEAANEVRIILERGDNTALADFNYTYDKKPSDTTTIYQFGLMMDKNGLDIKYNNTRLNCGHMYFMKLADNSIVVIDGGGIQQMSDSTAVELLRLFREVTGTPEGEKVKISCWFISHRHPDHYNGFTRFLTKYAKQLEIERVLYNIQDTNGDIDRIRGLLNGYYKDILYHKPHTGETIRLADVEFETIYTLEDQVNTRTGAIESTDFNDTSTVLRITFDGAVMLLLGDASGGAEKILVKNYDKTFLKSDILQVAHHGWNNLSSLYNAVKPTISLYPQSSGGAEQGLSGNAAKVLDRVKQVSEELYFAGDETVGVTIVNGKPTVTYRHAVVGEEYTCWSW